MVAKIDRRILAPVIPLGRRKVQVVQPREEIRAAPSPVKKEGLKIKLDFVVQAPTPLGQQEPSQPQC